MNFTDQVVLITGATNGIGRALALDFAARGAIVVGCGRDPERLEETSKSIRARSPSAKMIRCDVGSRSEVAAMLAAVHQELGRIDILINNAGIGMRKPFAATPLDTIEAIMRTNYLGMVYCTHGALPGMIARGSGHIVNISSVAGIVAVVNMAGYAASKFAMNGFSESLYHEVKPLGIEVTVICPGPVRTGFARGFADATPKSPESLVISAEEVSRLTIAAVENKRFEKIMPGSLALVCGVKRRFPGLFRILAHGFFRKHAKANPEAS